MLQSSWHQATRWAVVAVLAALPAFAAAPLKIRSHTAPAEGFFVSSYALESGGETVIVDAQLLATEAKKLAETLKQSKAKVTTIFITHPHPDHYLGLAALKAAFPTARIVATADTAETIAAEGPARLKFYREQFANGAMAPKLATEIPAVEKLKGTTLKVGQTELEILSFPNAETKVAHALWDKTSGALIAGDLVYNNVHLWLADQPPAGWIEALQAIAKMRPKKIYPGHGEPGGPELVTQNAEYLAFAEKAIKESKSGPELARKLQDRFPDLRGPGMVNFAAQKYFPAPATSGGGGSR